MAAGTTGFQQMLSWFVAALCAALLIVGVAWYGLSLDVHERFWADIKDRVHGPMTFRFALQPTMAFLAALHDGIRDAREGHKSFFWTAWWDREAQPGRLREGFNSIARVILLGISMDAIYQFKVLDHFYPVEALMMAILLAVIPYFIFRWVVEIVARSWFAREGRRTR